MPHMNPDSEISSRAAHPNGGVRCEHPEGTTGIPATPHVFPFRVGGGGTERMVRTFHGAATWESVR